MVGLIYPLADIFSIYRYRYRYIGMANGISLSAISVSVSVSVNLDIGYIGIGQILAKIHGYRPKASYWLNIGHNENIGIGIGDRYMLVIIDLYR
jgi:hypothetical protein